MFYRGQNMLIPCLKKGSGGYRKYYKITIQYETGRMNKRKRGNISLYLLSELEA